jgi:hypothetical protein
MKGTNIIGQVWPLLWLPLTRAILIIVSLVFVPRNLFSIIFTIIFINTVIDVLTDKELTLKKTLKRWLFTIIFFSTMGLVYYIGGLWGVIGLGIAGISVTILILAYTLHANWAVYDAVTTWGAKRIKGKTKKDFDLNEVMKNEQRRKSKVNKRL